MIDLQNISLLPYNTFGMDVRAKRYVACQQVTELIPFLKENCSSSEPLLPIGGGSNLLFTSDFEGTILRVTIPTIEVVAETVDYVEVKCGAGIVWDDFVAYAVAHQWYGIENLSLIPGEVGASAIQNIGAYGVEVADVIRYVDTVEVETGMMKRFTNAECAYAYRQSIFKTQFRGKFIVTHVTYRLSKSPYYTLHYGNVKAELEKRGWDLSLQHVRDTIIAIRREKLPDPAEVGNAGSFFMNPLIGKAKFEALKVQFPAIPHYPIDDETVKIPAGWLIEQTGWKGKALGKAGVHPKQALVLINLGGASGEEVIKLATAIIEDVNKMFGIMLYPEVNYVEGGFLK